MEYQSGAVSPIESIKNGWNLIKDNYWTYFLMYLVLIVIVIAIAMVLGTINNVIVAIISGGMGAVTQNSGTAGNVSAMVVPQIISMIIGFFVNIIVGTISGVLMCGLYKAFSRQASGGMAEFGDLFSGFDKIQPCLIYSIVLSIFQFVLQGIALAIGVGAGVGALGVGGLIGEDGKPNPAVLGGFVMVMLAIALIYIIVGLVFSALTAFVYPLIADKNLSAGQALSLSFKAGFSNIGGLILLMVLLGLMIFGGALLCFVGMLFVIPIVSAAMFSAYQDVFGRTQNVGFQRPPPPPNFGY